MFGLQSSTSSAVLHFLSIIHNQNGSLTSKTSQALFSSFTCMLLSCSTTSGTLCLRPHADGRSGPQARTLEEHTRSINDQGHTLDDHAHTLHDHTRAHTQHTHTIDDHTNTLYDHRHTLAYIGARIESGKTQEEADLTSPPASDFVAQKKRRMVATAPPPLAIRQPSISPDDNGRAFEALYEFARNQVQPEKIDSIVTVAKRYYLITTNDSEYVDELIMHMNGADPAEIIMDHWLLPMPDIAIRADTALQKALEALQEYTRARGGHGRQRHRRLAPRHQPLPVERHLRYHRRHQAGERRASKRRKRDETLGLDGLSLKDPIENMLFTIRLASDTTEIRKLRDISTALQSKAEDVRPIQGLAMGSGGIRMPLYTRLVIGENIHWSQFMAVGPMREEARQQARRDAQSMGHLDGLEDDSEFHQGPE
ncbi:hypothetical protein DFH27DRAFT_606500 [Peziza echinospora]|nr:hypothetical protein DFH27DRAFT_606500 [Peziza echinospora]